MTRLELSACWKNSNRLASELHASAVSDCDFFNLAFVQALVVESAETDLDLDDSKRKERVQQYLERAIEDLRAMYATRKLSKQQFADLSTNNEFPKTPHKHPAYIEFRDEFKN